MRVLRGATVAVIITAIVVGASLHFAKPSISVLAPPLLPTQSEALMGPALRRFGFSLETSGVLNGALGSVFSFTSADSSVTCGAGFISTVGTRIYSNQNELEFWCRQSHDTLRLKWHSVGRPIKDFPSAMIGNVRGRLFDYIANKFYDFDLDRWIDMARDDRQRFGGSRIYTMRRDRDQTWLVIHNLPACPGLSVYSDDGYRGTVETGSDFSAAMVWDGTFYVNADGTTWAVDLPSAKPLRDCVRLARRVLIDEPNYVYAIFGVADLLIIGGGGRPRLRDDRFECLSIYMADGNEVNVMSLEGCENNRVTEIYSFTLYGDALWAGTYPDGRLYRVDIESGVATRGSFPDPPVGSWSGPLSPNADSLFTSRYLESQSISTTVGRLLIGIFPWGEIVQIDAKNSQQVYRLFARPERVASRHPFEEAAETASCPERRQGCLEALSGAEFWGQRVTSLAVLDGRVCAGTGNTYSERFDAAMHTFISFDVAAEYGQVHCAELENQTLAHYRIADRTELTFEISDDYLVIRQDGELAAARKHHLDAAAVAAIADPEGVLRIGEGSYGPSQATRMTKRELR